MPREGAAFPLRYANWLDAAGPKSVRVSVRFFWKRGEMVNKREIRTRSEFADRIALTPRVGGAQKGELNCGAAFVKNFFLSFLLSLSFFFLLLVGFCGFVRHFARSGFLLVRGCCKRVLLRNTLQLVDCIGRIYVISCFFFLYVLHTRASISKFSFLAFFFSLPGFLLFVPFMASLVSTFKVLEWVTVQLKKRNMARSLPKREKVGRVRGCVNTLSNHLHYQRHSGGGGRRNANSVSAFGRQNASTFISSFSLLCFSFSYRHLTNMHGVGFALHTLNVVAYDCAGGFCREQVPIRDTRV